jgi:small conductance mechanosensitive channel
MIRSILNIAGCVLVALCLLGPVNAQVADGQVDLQPLPEQVAAQFDQKLADIAFQKEEVERLGERIEELEGAFVKVLVARQDRIWTSMFRSTVDLAKEVATQRANGINVSTYRETLAIELAALPEQSHGAMERLRGRVVFPSDDLAPKDFVIADRELFKAIGEVDRIFAALITYVDIAEKFDLEASADREFVVDELTESAANRSIFLELALDDVAVLRSTITTLSTNTELADWLSAAQARVQLTAKAMQDMISLMNSLGLETRHYRRQVLTATGEITTDVLDVGIVASLLSQWGKSSFDLLIKEGPRLIFRLLLVMFILFAFFQLAKLVQKGVDRALGSVRVSVSHLLHRMIVSSIRNLVVLFGILIAISQLGVSLGPLLAGLGIVGFIIGFALQDSLSNFASGMMILMYRPFDVGDTVEAGGVRGKVSHMSLVNTTFMTFDNQKLVVPNNLIWQTVITNVTAQHSRRVDLTFGISYGDDIEKAEKVLREVVEEHDAVLDNPKPMIKVHELGESSVNLIVRPWVKTSDYWDTYWDLTKAVKMRFDAEGISIPFPQRDVHVIEKK